jgi:hypothetical protein
MKKLFINLERFFKGQSAKLLKKEETLVLGLFHGAITKLQALATKQEQHLADIQAELDELAAEKAAVSTAQTGTTNAIQKIQNLVA